MTEQTNVEKLTALYKQKAEAGLVDVKFVLSDTAKSASVEEIAGELLALEEAVQAGRSTPLDFGDYSWKRADEPVGTRKGLTWTKKRKGFSHVYTTPASTRAIVHTRFGKSPGVWFDGRQFDDVATAQHYAEGVIATESRVTAQSEIDGLRVADMLLQFQSDFRHVYGYNPNMLFPGVGPMQSFLGWAAQKNYIKIVPVEKNTD